MEAIVSWQKSLVTDLYRRHVLLGITLNKADIKWWQCQCVCRNAYANYYQYIGQRRFLEELQRNGSTENVVFMDMDVLVLDSIIDIFCQDYGYAVTINANSYDPVDIGLQFVHHNHYGEAIAFLQVTCFNGSLTLLKLCFPQSIELYQIEHISNRSGLPFFIL